jgi:hypothetical protein
MVEKERTVRAWFVADPVRSAVLLVGLHVVFSVILWFGFIGAAYGFSDGRVASYDELTYLGSGPGRALAAISQLLVLSAFVTLFALLVVRRFAWVVPVLGMLASTTAAVYYFTTLEHPAPLVGG